MALAVGAGAGDDGHGARALHANAAALPAQCRRLHVGGQTHAYQLAALPRRALLLTQLLVLGELQRLLEGRGVVAGVVDAAGGRAVGKRVGGNEVAPPDVGGIQAQRPRRFVEQALHEEDALGPARAAIGAGGHRGRVGGAGLDIDGRHHVGPGQRAAMVRGRNGAAEHDLRAQRVHDAGPHPEDAALGIHRQLALGLAAAPVVGDREVLPPRGDPFHRMAEPAGQPRQQHVLTVGRAFDAEATADVGRDDADATLVEAEARGDLRADTEGRLRGRPHRQLVEVRVVGGEDGARIAAAGRAGLPGPGIRSAP